MKIAILDDYQDCVRHLDCFNLLTGHEVKIFTNSARGIGQLAIRLADFDALVLIRERSRIPAQLLNKLPKLKVIAQTGKASGHIDVAAATRRGVAILEGASDATAPAELTWALIMAATRHIPQYAANLQSGTWQTVSMNAARNQLGTRLKGKTLAIWGYGKIGRLVAGYGKAFGMNVVIWGGELSRSLAVENGYEAAQSKASFFADADVMSMHLRLTDETRGIVTPDDFARMKPTSIFVNTSRAGLVAPGALEISLLNGRPGFAALDVFETEPLPIDAPLLRMENVLATPHLGYVEKNSYELYFGSAFQNLVDFASGVPMGVLNPDALKR
jgi:D-3-phosphoglycerate dehydrogenase